MIVFIVVLETGQSQFYASKTKFACMHRLNLAAKKHGKKGWFTLQLNPRKAQ